jgi:hypothetical protein
MKRLEQQGRFEVVKYETEPESWFTVLGVEVRPDLYVELGDRVRSKLTSWWLEIDMGTERKKQLADKMNDYYHAWQHAQDDAPPSYTKIIFLVPDDARADVIRGVIRQQPADAQDLFDVGLTGTFPQSLLVV